MYNYSPIPKILIEVTIQVKPLLISYLSKIIANKIPFILFKKIFKDWI